MNEAGPVVSRKLQASDIPAAEQLSADAGWNQTREDWQLLIDLAPEGCLAIEVEGELAATTTLLCYGKRLAWVGMVLTKLPYRGRGFARRLLTDALTLADRLGIETVKLDATDQGQPLYEKLGFRGEQAVERWTRQASSDGPGPKSLLGGAAGDWHEADRRASGVDRSQLLDKLAARNPKLSIGSSYLLTRPGRVTRYLGPCVADDPRSAQALIHGAVQNSGGDGWSWDLLPENVDAIAIAQELSFAPKRHLLRMVRGKDLRTQDEAIYAIAGFELG